MLDEIIHNPDLAKYSTAYEIGQTVFAEGDTSQDLYILVSGQLDVFKSKKKIAEISETGSLFGEMSFILGAKRTATIKTKDNVTTLCIPREEITTFLQEYPLVSEAISKLMAKRLDEASQILSGLKEFCDQLPDAVILTDREMKILAWNTAAEELYGREADQMRYKPVDEIYEEPQAYNDFLEDVKSHHSISEKVLGIKHPGKGKRFISTSTSLLYDGSYNIQGVLSISRDVTAVETMHRKYRRIRKWFIPSFILLGLLLLIVVLGYPYFSKGVQSADVKKIELRNHLAKDFLLLKSQLLEHFENNDLSKMNQLMKNYFKIQEASVMLYTGLVLLDSEKKVLSAFSIKPNTDVTKIIGSSYSGLEFKGNEKSLHKLLIMYRSDKDNPMGRKYVEIAFPMNTGQRFLGWLVFQMDIEMLEKKYEINEEDLINFQINER